MTLWWSVMTALMCTRQFSSCATLRVEGAILSPKSVLEPLIKIDWLGKHLFFFGSLAGVSILSKGWQILLGLWIRTAIMPLSRTQSRRVVGHFSWALGPHLGSCPFLGGCWSHILWGSTCFALLPCARAS